MHRPAPPPVALHAHDSPGDCSDALMALGVATCDAVRSLRLYFCQPAEVGQSTSRFVPKPGWGVLGYRRRRISGSRIAELSLPLLRTTVFEESTPDRSWSPDSVRSWFSPRRALGSAKRGADAVASPVTPRELGVAMEVEGGRPEREHEAL